MRTNPHENPSPGSPWRIATWSAAACLLVLPLLAMQVTDQVAWGVADFVIFGAMLAGAGFTYEMVVRMTGNSMYRSAVGVALATAFLLVWLSLGVGIIGADGDPANLMYFGVLAIGIVGAIAARFRAEGMARAVFAMAAAQATVGAIAVLAGLGRPWSGPLELVALNGFFVTLFCAAGWMFQRAAAGQSQGTTA